MILYGQYSGVKLASCRSNHQQLCFLQQLGQAKNKEKPWWRHQMETFSALLALCAGNSPVPGEFPTQRQVARSFDVFFDLRLNKRLSKQSWGWWFETPSCSLRRYCNVDVMHYWPCARGIHQWAVVSPHKGAVMQGALSDHDFVIGWVRCIRLKLPGNYGETAVKSSFGY